MAGIGVAQLTAGKIRHDVRSRGKHRNIGVLENSREFGVQLSQELSGLVADAL